MNWNEWGWTAIKKLMQIDKVITELHVISRTGGLQSQGSDDAYNMSTLYAKNIEEKIKSAKHEITNLIEDIHGGIKYGKNKAITTKKIRLGVKIGKNEDRYGDRKVNDEKESS